ncbi:FmdB family zinc ribbon protein, partial [Micromonospora arida]
PTYQYACTTYGQQLEAVQSFSDEPLTECPACRAGVSPSRRRSAA